MKPLNKFLLLLLVIFTFASCDPFQTIIEADEDEKSVFYESETIITPSVRDTLLVANWNIKFGGGRIDFFFDCYGERVLMSEEEVKSNMKKITDEINHINPDILFLQEVDVKAKRSAYVDQLQRILDHTDLNYAYYGSQWKADYVPSDGIGRVNSGNAILSKYPLSNGKRIPLSLIDDQAGIVQYFYLRRNLLQATVTVNGKEIVVFGTHTSAYSTDGTRAKQLAEVKEKVATINDNGQKFILAGDFNTIPPNSIVFENFDDNACEGDPDFEAQSFKEELDLMNIYLDDFEPAISQERYDLDNAAYFSFTSNKDGFWNRKLDYIFTNGDFVDGSGIVLQNAASGGTETMPLSDHAPMTVQYLLK